MLGLMVYERGLKFKNVVFENENAARLWCKKNKVNLEACHLVEVEYFKEDDKELQKVLLEEEIATRVQHIKWLREMYELSKVESIKEAIIGYERQLRKLKTERENLK